MTTHRSLNKLEFKAHMSIHNMVEVSEQEMGNSNFTRDRLGKRHVLREDEGMMTVHARIKKAATLTLFLVFFGAGSAMAEMLATEAPAKKGPNFQISSDDPEVARLRDPLNPEEERFSFYKEGNTSLEINEDGDPNLSTRF